MADNLSLEVVTPFRTVLIENVDSVTLPGIEGELGILPEQSFYMVGTIDQVMEKARKLSN